MNLVSTDSARRALSNDILFAIKCEKIEKNRKEKRGMVSQTITHPRGKLSISHLIRPNI